MSAQKYIKSITETFQDDFPVLTPLTADTTVSSANSSYFSNISWQTWVIIVLLLALVGINVFAILAKGTQETATIFQEVFAPIIKLFGYTTLEATKQTIDASATGAKAGVDIVAGTATGAIDTITSQNQQPQMQTQTQTLSTNQQLNNIRGQYAKSSLPVQNKIQQAGANEDQWQQDTLEKALNDATQETAGEPSPDNSGSSIQSSGKTGWCYIGESSGIRTCAEIGKNDQCMSGNVFPNQAICVNPNLRT